MHHAQLFEHNSFLTLTYNPETLASPSLDHRDWQLFMKRLRKESKKRVGASESDLPGCKSPRETRDGGAESQISYYMAGEYGTNTRRPHFHACLFNYQFKDKKYWKTIPKTKSKLYVSNDLNRLWGKGFTSIGDVNIQSAAYIARYIMAKQTGKDAWKYYQHINEETGEIYDLEPEYNRMSLKHAIGKEWLKKYQTDVYPEGMVRVGGVAAQAPRYYDKQFAELDAEAFEQMKNDRQAYARQFRNDNTPRRLEAKERVKIAQLNQLLRQL